MSGRRLSSASWRLLLASPRPPLLHPQPLKFREVLRRRDQRWRAAGARASRDGVSRPGGSAPCLYSRTRAGRTTGGAGPARPPSSPPPFGWETPRGTSCHSWAAARASADRGCCVLGAPGLEVDPACLPARSSGLGCLQPFLLPQSLPGVGPGLGTRLLFSKSCQFCGKTLRQTRQHIVLDTPPRTVDGR